MAVTCAENKRDHVEDAFLVVKRDGRWDQVFRLAHDATTSIGRAKKNDVMVMDHGCSRHHCQIVFDGDSDEWLLHDLDSSNGTRLNGKKISGNVQLNDGVVIQIGQVHLGFTVDLTQPFARFEKVSTEAEPIVIVPGEDDRDDSGETGTVTAVSGKYDFRRFWACGKIRRSKAGNF